MSGVQPPHWDLAPAALTPGEGIRVIFEDYDAVLPVLVVVVKLQSIPRVGGSWETGK